MSNNIPTELVAKLADAYNPLLLCIAIVIALYFLVSRKEFYGLRLVASAIVVYGLMFLDNLSGVWPSVGLDYSTHTATSLAMCVFIATAFLGWTIAILLFASLLVYAQAMVMLGYHSWADILSTAGVVLICLSPIYAKKWRKPTSNHNELVFADKLK